MRLPTSNPPVLGNQPRHYAACQVEYNPRPGEFASRYLTRRNARAIIGDARRVNGATSVRISAVARTPSTGSTRGVAGGIDLRNRSSFSQSQGVDMPNLSQQPAKHLQTDF